MKIRPIPELDTLRFFAITLVVLHHQFFQSNFIFEWFYNYGWLGVDVFFTLSGFIITRTLLVEFQRTKLINLRHFWIKRAFRLWPSWLIILILSFLATLYVARSNPDVLERVHKYWFHYFLHFANYSHAYFGKVHTFTSHFWSLAVEEHFYLLWPVMMSIGLKRDIKKIWIVLPLLIIPYLLRLLHHAMGLETITITFSTHTRLDGIAWGCLLALYFDKIHDLLIKEEVLLTILSMALFFMAGPLKSSHLPYALIELNRVLISIATCLMIILAMKGGRFGVRSILKSQFLSKLGILSYGVYLVHFLTNAITFSFISNHFGIKNDVILVLLNLILPYIPAYFLYKYVDMPFIKLRGRFIK